MKLFFKIIIIQIKSSKILANVDKKKFQIKFPNVLLNFVNLNKNLVVIKLKNPKNSKIYL